MCAGWCCPVRSHLVRKSLADRGGADGGDDGEPHDIAYFLTLVVVVFRKHWENTRDVHPKYKLRDNSSQQRHKGILETIARTQLRPRTSVARSSS